MITFFNEKTGINDIHQSTITFREGKHYLIIYPVLLIDVKTQK